MSKKTLKQSFAKNILEAFPDGESDTKGRAVTSTLIALSVVWAATTIGLGFNEETPDNTGSKNRDFVLKQFQKKTNTLLEQQQKLKSLTNQSADKQNIKTNETLSILNGQQDSNKIYFNNLQSLVNNQVEQGSLKDSIKIDTYNILNSLASNSDMTEQDAEGIMQSLKTSGLNLNEYIDHAENANPAYLDECRAEHPDNASKIYQCSSNSSDFSQEIAIGGATGIALQVFLLFIFSDKNNGSRKRLEQWAKKTPNH